MGDGRWEIGDRRWKEKGCLLSSIFHLPSRIKRKIKIKRPVEPPIPGG
jgi:hypothetical protein